MSDPAVFADVVFGKITADRRAEQSGTSASASGWSSRARGIFKDNGIRFTAAEQKKFWLDVIALLGKRGYDYKLFTTGHFSDEDFLDDSCQGRRVAS